MAQKWQYWLVKTEPTDYPWSKMVADKTTAWTGVHNHQAQNYLRTMKVGDSAFFYHTGKERAIVGIVRVVKPFYHSSDQRYGEVDVEAAEPLEHPVTLEALKESDKLQGMAILRQPRLSVAPITPDEWDAILELSKTPYVA